MDYSMRDYRMELLHIAMQYEKHDVMELIKSAQLLEAYINEDGGFHVKEWDRESSGLSEH